MRPNQGECLAKFKFSRGSANCGVIEGTLRKYNEVVCCRMLSASRRNWQMAPTFVLISILLAEFSVFRWRVWEIKRRKIKAGVRSEWAKAFLSLHFFSPCTFQAMLPFPRKRREQQKLRQQNVIFCYSLFFCVVFLLSPGVNHTAEWANYKRKEKRRTKDKFAGVSFAFHKNEIACLTLWYLMRRQFETLPVKLFGFPWLFAVYDSLPMSRVVPVSSYPSHPSLRNQSLNKPST